MTKPLHAGRAAENGVVAAELASRGFTGGDDGARRPVGLLPGARRRRRSRSPRFRVLGKPLLDRQPGRLGQAVPVRLARAIRRMDAMLKLVIEHDVKPEQIKARARARRLEHPRAAALQDREDRARGEVLPAVPDGEHRCCGARPASASSPTSSSSSAPVQQMMPRVDDRLRSDDRGAAASTRFAASSRSIWRTAGRSSQASDDRYRGGPERPFTREELHEKFTDCASLVAAGRDRDPARARSDRVGRADQEHPRADSGVA